jgi:epoxyqueuosine reductase
MNHAQTAETLGELKNELVALARRRGFDALGVSDVDLGTDVAHFTCWLGSGFHGEMDYMWKHGQPAHTPGRTRAGTVRVLSARMNYCRPREGRW